MASSNETAAQLAAAQTAVDDNAVRIEALQAEDGRLSREIGEAVANGSEPKAAKKARTQVRDEWEDALHAQGVLTARFESAKAAHADALKTEHAAKLETGAECVRSAADVFERAVAGLVSARAAFVSAGRNLVALAKQGGDSHSHRFSTETLSEDVLQRRLYGRQNPEFDKAVPALVAPTLLHLETL